MGRRAEGQHNAVSSDMLLEKKYNADAKEEGGLGGITKNEASRDKWVYTRHVTAAVSSKFNAICHLKTNISGTHHDSGKSRVTKDINLVRNTMASVEFNPFTCDSPHLLNVATGEVTEKEVRYDLTHIREIGLDALQKTITSTQKKCVNRKTPHIPESRKIEEENRKSIIKSKERRDHSPNDTNSGDNLLRKIRCSGLHGQPRM